MLNKFLFASVLAVTAPVTAAEIVAPNAQATAEGNANSRDLFATITLGRYQQVYAGSQFGTAPVTLTGLSFRPNATSTVGFNLPGNAFSTSFELQFNLSTTALGPDTLTNVFAANVGSDVTTVIRRGRVAFSSANTGPAAGPRDFDVNFTFDVPFTFDPMAGNLLLDVLNFSGGSATPGGNGGTLDAQTTLGDAVSSLYRSGNTTFATGTLNTRGFVTRFQIADVPEPAALALLGLGLIGLAGLRHRRG